MTHHYIFDVDETLYPSHHPFAKTIGTIGWDYLASLMDYDADEARKIIENMRKTKQPVIQKLWDDHNIPIAEIIRYPEKLDYTQFESDELLRDQLHQLNGLKHIYTDGVQTHAQNVVTALGLTHVFENLFSTETANYYYKDSVNDFNHILTHIQTEGKSCTFVEDKVSNLKPAKASGMLTIWLTQSDENIPEWVDETAPNLPTWLQTELERT